MTRKLIESTFVSLDGVIENPHHWSPPYWDDQHSGYAASMLDTADTLLLGRETYESFAEVWPQRSGDPYTDKVNAMPKYVASRTLETATWNATILDGDIAEQIAKLKELDGGDILKFGTGELDRTLLAHRLVDEFHFWYFPVIVGSGQRLLDDVDVTHLQLAGSTVFDSGIVVLKLTPK
jgi:dihydrofolate reductase